MFSKTALVTKHSRNWRAAVRMPKREASQPQVFRNDRSIIEGLQDIVSLLEEQLRPLVQSELSVLVDVLHRPELLFPSGTDARKKCESGGFISKLIKHTERLLEEKEEKLCIKVLKTLQDMMAIETDSGEKGENLRQLLLLRFFGKSSSRPAREQGLASNSRTRAMSPNYQAGVELVAAAISSHGPGSTLLVRAAMTLAEVQCHLDQEGASDLVVELVMRNPGHSIFVESVNLGISLLEGGNPVIQKSLFNKLTTGGIAERFFKVFYDKMRLAQAEIKATVSVNTAELTTKTSEDKDQCKDGDKSSRKGKGLKPNGVILTEEAKVELDNAALATSKAYTQVRTTPLNNAEDSEHSMAGHGGTVLEEMLSEKLERAKDKEDEETLSPTITVMQPILRFLQLLCENHNRELQNFLRNQLNKNNFNLVSETLMFLDCICGSTTGGLGLLGLYINENNVGLINQTLETLTEYCQGPCHENQNCIATHESNGLDIITALILNDINPLGKTRMDLVLELKNNASKLLLAIMESRGDTENAERILYNMSPRQLLDVACKAFHQEGIVDEHDNDDENGDYEDEAVSPKEVGHNIYILCHQLAQHNKELASLLKPSDFNNHDPKVNRALEHYASHTAQIEIIRHDRTMEQIVFPVPQICEFITQETKMRVLQTTERDDQGSKVADFFERCETMFAEMKWQKKLRSQPLLFWVSSYMSMWSSITFNLAVFINLIVAIFYPFGSNYKDLDPRVSGLIWAGMLVCLALVITVPRTATIRSLVVFAIFRVIFSVGLQPSLWLLGAGNVIIKSVQLVSIMGNQGTFSKSPQQILMDVELFYHVLYLLVCILGLLMHPFFYSILLLDVVYREETLLNVINSVTRNGRSIILTAVLALILVYLFSIIGFLFFRDDFLMEVESNTPLNTVPTLHVPDNEEQLPSVNATNNSATEHCVAGKACNYTEKSAMFEAAKFAQVAAVEEANEDEEERERACDSLIMCIITTLNQGLRNGGGIGDVLRSPSRKEPLFMARVVYDLLFFFVVIIIVLNLIFGVIIDTFADLRSEKQTKEEVLKNSCFICALGRAAFDNKATSFDEHIKSEHNMWHYLYFIVLVKVKDPTEFTGPESYVYAMVQDKNLDWFPRMRAMSLAADEGEGEQNEIRILQSQLEKTQVLVTVLSKQLTELRDQMTEQRKQKQRIGLLNPPAIPGLPATLSSQC